MLCCSGERYRAIMALLFVFCFRENLSDLHEMSGLIFSEKKYLGKPSVKYRPTYSKGNFDT